MSWWSKWWRRLRQGRLIPNCTWRQANAGGAIVAAALWAVATYTDWVSSVEFVSHMSMLALVVSFIAAWRADVPNGRQRG